MARRALTLLVTGFGPFPGIPVNPTEGLARRLARSGRFRRIGIDVVAHVFATRWATVARDLPKVLAGVKPDAVLHLGVAGRRRKISIETIARPSPSRIAPDAGGRSAASSSDPTHGDAPLKIAAPAQPLLSGFIAAGAPAHLSNDAGRYLCNALYHQSLAQRRDQSSLRPTVFIHVPMPGPTRSSPPSARVRSRKPRERETINGLENAMLALARAARNGRR
ncbi:MAG: hypothetical protein BGP06_16255 [Rhizobiales bacterium 65-9]|nr:peptidase C15 [Hyphomicrobiales bacterium]OJY38017.1 MAG: hypothetical protein BGP06_16255 [Rhizobiales bacterium 65-9]